MIQVMTDEGDNPAELIRVTYALSKEELAELSRRPSGELRVVAAAWGFAGDSSAWFGAEVVLKFAAALSAYPLPEDGPITLSDLADSGTDPDGEYLGMLVQPIGIKGQVGFRVHLAASLGSPRERCPP
jgi:hypothetical protein